MFIFSIFEPTQLFWNCDSYAITEQMSYKYSWQRHIYSFCTIFFFLCTAKANQGKDGVIGLCIISVPFCNLQLLDAVKYKYVKSLATHRLFPRQKWKVIVFILFDAWCSSEHCQLFHLLQVCHLPTYICTVKWSHAVWRSH